MKITGITKYIIVVLIAVFAIACQQNNKLQPPYAVVFYNVENLFDTINNPNKFDDEFTPDSHREWNTERYFKKLEDLSKVIYSIDSVKLPVLVGISEVENDIALNDLAAQPLLKKAGYKVVWDEGNDFRGIDCALLYNPSVFTLNQYEYIPVDCPVEPEFITREILYVKGSMHDELFHVFVMHWPSRRGGADESEPKRVLAASILRRKVDAIFKEYETPNIIIMGDMNDEPSDMSLADVLMALPNNVNPENDDLVNLMYSQYKKGKGTYNFRGEWNMIDNIIVSGYLINKSEGLKVSLHSASVFHRPFMEFVNDRGEMSPNRTYGRTYFGGISDHFPIYMVLE